MSYVLESENRLHAFNVERPACVEAGYAGVGVGTAKNSGVQHPRKLDVVDVSGGSGQEADVFFAPYRGSDVLLCHYTLGLWLFLACSAA